MIKKQKLKSGGTKVTFVLPLEDAPQATSVAGDFNGWNPLTHPLKKRSNGTRSVSVELAEGQSLQFRYLADGGHWFNDPDVEADDSGNCAINC